MPHPASQEADHRRAKRGLEEELEEIVTGGSGNSPEKIRKRPPTPPIEKWDCNIEEEENWDTAMSSDELSRENMTTDYSGIPPRRRRRRHNSPPRRHRSPSKKMMTASGSDAQAHAGGSERNGSRRPMRRGTGWRSTTWSKSQTSALSPRGAAERPPQSEKRNLRSIKK